LTEQELQYLNRVEEELIYEHQKAMSFLDRARELSEEIVNRPREAGIEGALKRYMETREILQSLETSKDNVRSLTESQQNFLPPIAE
jgi:hypothetical protein